MPRELDFLLWQSVVDQKENDSRHADSKRNGVDGFVVRRIFGKITPLAEIKGAKGTIIRVDHDLGLALKKQGQSAPGSADIDGLPQPVQHKNMLIQQDAHGVKP
jgi:hypothetical protein